MKTKLSKEKRRQLVICIHERNEAAEFFHLQGFYAELVRGMYENGDGYRFVYKIPAAKPVGMQ